ncbi:DUF7716 domain-containing protein [Dickeya chrysanthemi]|uniref:DUF7716 domain-containing protein n=1 Tax=Dickeya chrysanthemi TaxID=556 RepID=A0ABU8JPU1_DICCH|nr:hypothetical protein [Dickeya chrysanthemi]MBX9448088.1 hypothetical protein [Dickeya chrysanthemi]MCA7007170.1 hypothetical protein [Dickeya chrysanthemi]
MIVISGFDDLLKKYKDLPNVGWLYVESSFDLESKDDIKSGTYYLAENEDEEMDFEENYGTFLEAPIFTAIIENKFEHDPNAKNDDLFDAVLFYINNDDFLD